MNITVSGKLSGTVTAPPSKSQSHRLMIASFLCREDVTVQSLSYSNDILATLDCCKSLGALFETGSDRVRFSGFEPRQTAQLNCGESGSTLRFMLPIAAALGVQSTFDGEGRLPKRPIDEMINLLSLHGVESTASSLPLTLTGKLQGGDFHTDPSESSQYLTGLLYALPILERDSRIYLKGAVQSRPYVDMTLQVLERFGISIEETDYGYFVKGRQRYSGVSSIVEGDFSNATFWLAAGAVGGGVCCSGLDMNSKQGDKEVCAILERFGCNITCTEGSVWANGGTLRGIAIDAAHIPDAVPALAVVAACAEGETTIYNAARLRIKESDRIKSVVDNLNAIGGNARETADGMVITGVPSLKGGTVDCCNDHRIAMAFSIASLRCQSPVVLIGAECVGKSYPHFFEDFKSLGGKADVINLG